MAQVEETPLERTLLSVHLSSTHRVVLLVAAVISIGVLVLAGSGGGQQLLKTWTQEEYSHAPLIPLLAIWVAYQRLAREEYVRSRASWVGVLFFCLALALAIIGQQGLFYTLSMYAIWLGIVACSMAILGMSVTKTVWVALAYLLFAIPLPGLLYNALSQYLQLVSSEFGVAGIRMLGISAHQAGNVIDLGSYKLQVVEACSGLRYLFPLASFGYLIAIMYRGSFWQKCVIALSTLPIAVVMNGLRIVVIGVLVEHWGIGAADGFLHYFEGWVVFIACLGLLFLVAAFMSRLSGNGESVIQRLDLDISNARKPDVQYEASNIRPVVALLVISLLVSPVVYKLLGAESKTPTRPNEFATFPLYYQGWIGRQGQLDADSLAKLNLSDYIIADYQNEDGAGPVNLYVAWYEAQHRGSTAHSPRACLPGGGWNIKSIGPHTLESVGYPGLKGSLNSLQVQRVIIEQGGSRQLVYYWFDQRGRNLTNEYAVKWYLFVDGLTKRRTDGSMLRLVTPIPEGMPVAEADRLLEGFLRSFSPQIRRYISS